MLSEGEVALSLPLKALTNIEAYLIENCGLWNIRCEEEKSLFRSTDLSRGVFSGVEKLSVELFLRPVIRSILPSFGLYWLCFRSDAQALRGSLQCNRSACPAFV